MFQHYLLKDPVVGRLYAKAGIQIKVIFKSKVLRLVGYAAYILPNIGSANIAD